MIEKSQQKQTARSTGHVKRPERPQFTRHLGVFIEYAPKHGVSSSQIGSGMGTLGEDSAGVTHEPLVLAQLQPSKFDTRKPVNSRRCGSPWPVSDLVDAPGFLARWCLSVTRPLIVPVENVDRAIGSRSKVETQKPRIIGNEEIADMTSDKTGAPPLDEST